MKVLALCGIVWGLQPAQAHMITDCERDCYDQQSDCYRDFENPIGANMCSQEEAECQMQCQHPYNPQRPNSGIESSFGSIDLL
jgi:hypothetical protein